MRLLLLEWRRQARSEQGEQSEATKYVVNHPDPCLLSVKVQQYNSNNLSMPFFEHALFCTFRSRLFTPFQNIEEKSVISEYSPNKAQNNVFPRTAVLRRHNFLSVADAAGFDLHARSRCYQLPLFSLVAI